MRQDITFQDAATWPRKPMLGVETTDGRLVIRTSKPVLPATATLIGFALFVPIIVFNFFMIGNTNEGTFDFSQGLKPQHIFLAMLALMLLVFIAFIVSMIIQGQRFLVVSEGEIDLLRRPFLGGEATLLEMVSADDVSSVELWKGRLFKELPNAPVGMRILRRHDKPIKIAPIAVSERTSQELLQRVALLLGGKPAANWDGGKL